MASAPLRPTTPWRSAAAASWAVEFTGLVAIPASGQTLIDPAATAEPFLFYRAVSVP